MGGFWSSYDNICAIDCEMVGSGNRSILARVSIVNSNEEVLLDTFVRPTAPVTDYRTWLSGITKEHLINAPTFSSVQQKVKSLIDGKVLIGHSLKFDFPVLGITHPISDIRDLATYPPLQRGNGQAYSLKELAWTHLKRRIQVDLHDSVEDAKASMAIYLKFATDWENSLQ